MGWDEVAQQLDSPTGCHILPLKLLMLNEKRHRPSGCPATSSTHQPGTCARFDFPLPPARMSRAGQSKGKTMTKTESISDLFDAWQKTRAGWMALPDQGAKAEVAAAVATSEAIEARALALNPETVADLSRLVVMSLDAPAADEPGPAAFLARKARELIGLPAHWTSEDGPVSAFAPRPADSLADLFHGWAAARSDLAALPSTGSDAEHLAACNAIYRLEDRAAALPPLTIADLWRKIVMVLDWPDPSDHTAEAQLAREARAALGLPLDWTPDRWEAFPAS